jgi:hypothetical protein
MERLVLSRWFAKHAPGALDPWLNRVAVRAREEELLKTHPGVLQIRPPLGSSDIGRTERGEAVLRDAVAVGITAAINELGSCIGDSFVRD